MTKHIMIPTDLSVRSLNLVRYAVNHFEGQPIKITLLHFMELPGSITDLLMIPRDGAHLRLITPEFREGISLLRNSYGSQIEGIGIDFLQGATRRMLKNYLENRKIDAILFPENYELKMPSKRSIDPSGMIRRCGWPVLSVKISRHQVPVQEESIAQLLLATA
ncbi:MAG TPA: universal stress protein [Phnomibacter sp.]|nr:universal stress protein [Phnomibacter sp.]